MKNNRMERGYIKIEENSQREFVVEAKLIDGNLWLSEHEIADLFNYIPELMIPIPL